MKIFEKSRVFLSILFAAILIGIGVGYNFFRPDSGLDGRTVLFFKQNPQLRLDLKLLDETDLNNLPATKIPATDIALYRLSTYRIKEGLIHVMRFADHTDPKMKAAAARALPLYAMTDSVNQKLLELLKHEDPQVAIAGLETLARVKDKKTIAFWNTELTQLASVFTLPDKKIIPTERQIWLQYARSKLDPENKAHSLWFKDQLKKKFKPQDAENKAILKRLAKSI